MKATRITKFGFTCPVCSDIHAPDAKLETTTMWELQDPNAVLAECYVIDEPNEVEVYRYDEENSEDCIGPDEPEYQECWQCSECETNYLDKDEAKECCKS